MRSSRPSPTARRRTGCLKSTPLAWMTCCSTSPGLRWWAVSPLVSRRDSTMLARRMSSAAKQTFLSARLPGFTGRGDKYLGGLAQDLRRVLWKTQSNFTYASCRLPDGAWSELAVLLVEWAEDIHNDLGLWRT